MTKTKRSGELKRAWEICAAELRRWPATPRLWIVGIFAFLWMHNTLGGIADFSRSVQEPAAPWGFPFAFTNWHLVLVAVLMEVLLFCNAPFMHDGTPFECIRSGRRAWIIGKLLYIWSGSLIFAVVLWLMSFAQILPNVEWTAEWGRVLRTLALTNAGANYLHGNASYSIVRDYAPVAANLICIALVTAQAALVGSVIFTLNAATRSQGWGVAAGIGLSMILGLESMVVGNVPKAIVMHFLPSGWVNLDQISLSASSSYPDYAYILTALSSICAALYAAVFRIYRTRDIDVMQTV